MSRVAMISRLLFVSTMIVGPIGADVSVTVEWTGKADDIRVVRSHIADQPASIFVDTEAGRVIVTNFEDDWDVKVAAGDAENPVISIQHTGDKTIEVVIKAFDSVTAKGHILILLERPGETMRLTKSRWVTLELRRKAD